MRQMSIKFQNLKKEAEWHRDVNKCEKAHMHTRYLWKFGVNTPTHHSQEVWTMQHGTMINAANLFMVCNNKQKISDS